MSKQMVPAAVDADLVDLRGWLVMVTGPALDGREFVFRVQLTVVC
jgi:hypothetical protein